MFFLIYVWYTDQYTGPLISDDHLTRELLLLNHAHILATMPQQTIIQHDGVSLHFCRQTKEYLNNTYTNRWIGHVCPHS